MRTIRFKELKAQAIAAGCTVESRVHPMYPGMWNFKATDWAGNKLVLEWSFGSRKFVPNGTVTCRVYPTIKGKSVKARPIKFERYSPEPHNLCKCWLSLFIKNRQAFSSIGEFNF